MLAAENMLKTFREKEIDREDSNDDENFREVLNRFKGLAAQSHRGIKYSDGKIRDSSFDD